MRRFKTDLPYASRPAPFQSSMQPSEYENQQPVTPVDHSQSAGSTPSRPRKSVEADATRSPLGRRQVKPYGDLYDSDGDLSFISPSSHRDSHDISFISSGRPSVDRSSFTLDFPESGRSSRISTSSEQSIGSHRLGIKFSDPGFPNDSSTTFS